jgi:hypothetical protein
LKNHSIKNDKRGGTLKIALQLCVVLGLIVSSIGSASTQEDDTYRLRFDLSPVWQTVNRVQIPTPGGTRFDFTSLGRGPAWNYRIDGVWRVGERSQIRALYAPLSLRVTGVLGSNVSFQDQVFSGSAQTEGLYRFNSYRLTYRYRLTQSERLSLWLGFTGKIRDAEIRLTQGSISASRDNVGFVPLLHLYTTYFFSNSFRVVLEADALAAPQGRAEDVALLLGWRVHPHGELFLGYRTVEGGADGGGKVYNFAWLHYAVLGVGVSF